MGGFRNGLREGEMLSMRVSARMGEEADGSPTDGHHASAGVALLFGAAGTPAALELSTE